MKIRISEGFYLEISTFEYRFENWSARELSDEATKRERRNTTIPHNNSKTKLDDNS